MANNGGNWRELVEQLGVKYKTAYTWIRSDAKHPNPKGGSRKKLTNDQIPKGGSRKKLTNNQIDNVVSMIERDPGLTLKHVCKSTIHNYLEGRLITLEKAHGIPATINADANKMLKGLDSTRGTEKLLFGWMRLTLTCSAEGCKVEPTQVTGQLCHCQPLRDQMFMLSARCRHIR